jgi:hypothetical protein
MPPSTRMADDHEHRLHCAERLLVPERASRRLLAVLTFLRAPGR